MSEKSTKFFPVIFGAFCLMLFSFVNNYPIVTGDSGSYINSGFNFSVPQDRPATYGFFLRFFSLGKSLWIPVFVQCLLLSFLLVRFLRSRIKGIPDLHVLAFMILVSLVTMGGWHASQLMPDIFTSILWLAIANYLFDDGDSKWLRAFYLLVILVSILMHNSHLILITLFCLFLLIYHFLKQCRLFSSSKILYVSLLCPLSWILLCSMNYAGGNGFTPSKASHVFLMGKLAESGVLKLYLDNNCPTKYYKICEYRDSIPPAAWEFVWDERSPLNKTGGWEANRQEYNTIIKDILSKPNYLILLGFKSIESTARQLVYNSIDGSYDLAWVKYLEETSPYENIKAFVPYDLNEFKYCGVNTKTLNIQLYNALFNAFLLFSSILLLFLWNREQKMMFLPVFAILIAYIVLNAFSTAMFANVLSRLNTRAIWLLPFMNMVFIYDTLMKKYRKETPE